MKKEDAKKETKIKKAFKYVFANFFDDLSEKLGIAFGVFLLMGMVLFIFTILYVYTSMLFILGIILMFFIAYIIANMIFEHRFE